MESGFRATSRTVLVLAVLLGGIVGNLTISLYLSIALPLFFGIAPILLSGLLFGIVVMMVMNFVVVPLGHAQAASRDPHALLNALVAHSAFFGLPVALVVRQEFSRVQPTQ